MLKKGFAPKILKLLLANLLMDFHQFPKFPKKLQMKSQTLSKLIFINY